MPHRDAAGIRSSSLRGQLAVSIAAHHEGDVVTDDQFSSPTPPGDPAAAATPATQTAPNEASAPPGWYPVADDELRYWDGATWSAHTAPAARPIGRPADYGEKYKRRYPVVLLVCVVLAGLSTTAVLPPFGRRIALGFTTSAAVFAGIGLTLLLFLTAAFWTLIAAAFKGEHRDPATPRPPLFKRAMTWALIAMVAFLPLRIYEFDTVEDIPALAVGGPAEGCRQYLDVTLLAARNRAKILNMPRYYQPLHDAARTTDPQLAQNLADFIAKPDEATFETTEREILTRCIEGGQITQAQLETWLSELKKAG
jgi:hypothetical protein